MRNVVRHASSFVAPIAMCFVLPLAIVRGEHRSTEQALAQTPAGLAVIGGAISIGGLSLVVATIRLFVLRGNGTIMPWDPTRTLVDVGPYRHVRNPMILGVLLTEIGEAIAFSSQGIAVLAGLFFAINSVYFVCSEEPGLEKRFGQEYIDYKQRVPRWIPRLRLGQPRT